MTKYLQEAIGNAGFFAKLYMRANRFVMRYIICSKKISKNLIEEDKEVFYNAKSAVYKTASRYAQDKELSDKFLRIAESARTEAKVYRILGEMLGRSDET